MKKGLYTFFMLCICSPLFATVAPIIPGEALWTLSKRIGETADIIESKVCEITNEDATIESKVCKIDTQADVIQSTVDIIESKVCEITNEDATIESKVCKIDTQADIIQSTVDIIESKVCEITNEDATIESKVCKIDTQADVIQSTVDIIESKVCEITNEDATIESKVCKIDTQADVIQSTIEIVESKVCEISNADATIESKVCKIDTQADIIQSTVDIIESKVCEITNEDATIESKVCKIDTQADVIQSTIEVIESKVCEISNADATIESKVCKIDTQADVIESKVCDLVDCAPDVVITQDLIPISLESNTTYCLAEKITLTSGVPIVINNVENVVLDLNGHEIEGDGSGTFNTVMITTSTHVNIKNGFIKNGNVGISIEDANSVLIEKIKLNSSSNTISENGIEIGTTQPTHNIQLNKCETIRGNFDSRRIVVGTFGSDITIKKCIAIDHNSVAYSIAGTNVCIFDSKAINCNGSIEFLTSSSNGTVKNFQSLQDRDTFFAIDIAGNQIKLINCNVKDDSTANAFQLAGESNNCLVDSCKVINISSGLGFNLEGTNHVVQNNIAQNINDEAFILGGSDIVLENNIGLGAGTGFSVMGSDNTVIGNIAKNNTNFGFNNIGTNNNLSNNASGDNGTNYAGSVLNVTGATTATGFWANIDCDIEGIDPTLSKICVIDSTIDTIESKVDQIPNIITQIDQTTDTTLSKVCTIDSQLDLIEQDANTIMQDITQSLSKICDVDSTLDVVESKIEGLNTQNSSNSSKISFLADADSCDQLIFQSDIPLTITQSGNYCLAENITFNQTTTAIIIDADCVRIDLNKKTLTGDQEIGSTGIFTMNHVDTIIENGVIKDFGIGIEINSSNNTVIQNIVTDNTAQPLAIIASENGIIRNVNMTRLHENILQTAFHWLIQDCSGSDMCTFGSTLTAMYNVVSGSRNCIFQNCKALNYTGITGFRIDSLQCIVQNCEAMQLTRGYQISSINSKLENCTAIQGSIGFDMDNTIASSIINCHAFENTTAGFNFDTCINVVTCNSKAIDNGIGFEIDNLSNSLQFRSNVATGNGTQGFRDNGSIGSLYVNNTANNNTQDFVGIVSVAVAGASSFYQNVTP